MSENIKKHSGDFASILDISNELLSLSVMLERAWSVTECIMEYYFGDRKEVHEKNGGANLVYCYDMARNFAGIANEYVCNAKEFTDRLLDHVDAIADEIRKGGAE